MVVTLCAKWERFLCASKMKLVKSCVIFSEGLFYWTDKWARICNIFFFTFCNAINVGWFSVISYLPGQNQNLYCHFKTFLYIVYIIWKPCSPQVQLRPWRHLLLPPQRGVPGTQQRGHLQHQVFIATFLSSNITI